METTNRTDRKTYPRRVGNIIEGSKKLDPFENGKEIRAMNRQV